MSSPIISIITVTFNAEQFLESTIKSVIDQEFEGLEYIIVDGASADNTSEIIRKYSKQIDQLICEPDKGVYDAMNKGLAAANGEYVLFLNAGDELASNTLLQNIFNYDEDTDLIYGETLILNPERKVLGTRTDLTSRKLPETLTKKDFLEGQVVSHQSFIPKKALCSPYHLEYRCSADIDWMLDIMDQARSIRKTDQPIAKYLQGGISDRNLKTCWKERFWILMKHFNPFIVIFKHLEFAVRYLKIGAYKAP
ncbi:MAG: glycosyltransferase involved in cell wall biosynthesis [Marinoscillum sp.]|jgi:glycosyltransferase involved in cell wall biosynthesis